MDKVIACLICLLLLSFSCNTTRDNRNAEPTEPATNENVNTEQDGVVKGETQEVISRPAVVETVKIYIKESFPVQVDVYATGYLPDGCTKISGATKNLDGNVFNLTIMTERPAHAICTQALIPYEHQEALEATGLKAGTYTVNVNGVRETFTLETDNVIPPDN